MMKSVTRFKANFEIEFVSVHNIQSKYAGRELVLEWKRGSKKKNRGYSTPFYLERGEFNDYNYVFKEHNFGKNTATLTSTLYQHPRSKRFKEKLLKLGLKVGGSVIAKAEINLAEYFTQMQNSQLASVVLDKKQDSTLKMMITSSGSEISNSSSSPDPWSVRQSKSDDSDETDFDDTASDFSESESTFSLSGGRSSSYISKSNAKDSLRKKIRRSRSSSSTSSLDNSDKVQTRFEITIVQAANVLSASSGQLVSISWKRGKKKKNNGHTPFVTCTAIDNQPTAVFNHTFRVDATLIRSTMVNEITHQPQHVYKSKKIYFYLEQECNKKNISLGKASLDLTENVEISSVITLPLAPSAAVLTVSVKSQTSRINGLLCMPSLENVHHGISSSDFSSFNSSSFSSFDSYTDYGSSEDDISYDIAGMTVFAKGMNGAQTTHASSPADTPQAPLPQLPLLSPPPLPPGITLNGATNGEKGDSTSDSDDDRDKKGSSEDLDKEWRELKREKEEVGWIRSMMEKDKQSLKKKRQELNKKQEELMKENNNIIREREDLLMLKEEASEARRKLEAQEEELNIKELELVGLKSELRQKEIDLEHREEEAAAKENDVKEREARVKQDLELLAEREARTTKMALELQNREASLSEREEKVKLSENQLKNREEQLLQRERDLSRKENDLASKQEMINSSHINMHQLVDKKLLEKEKELDERERLISEKLASIQRENEKSTKELITRESSLRAKDQQLLEREQTLLKRENDILARERDLQSSRSLGSSDDRLAKSRLEKEIEKLKEDISERDKVISKMQDLCQKNQALVQGSLSASEKCARYELQIREFKVLEEAIYFSAPVYEFEEHSRKRYPVAASARLLFEYLRSYFPSRGDEGPSKRSLAVFQTVIFAVDKNLKKYGKDSWSLIYWLSALGNLLSLIKSDVGDYPKLVEKCTFEKIAKPDDNDSFQMDENPDDPCEFLISSLQNLKYDVFSSLIKNGFHKLSVAVEFSIFLLSNPSTSIVSVCTNTVSEVLHDILQNFEANYTYEGIILQSFNQLYRHLNALLFNEILKKLPVNSVSIVASWNSLVSDLLSFWTKRFSNILLANISKDKLQPVYQLLRLLLEPEVAKKLVKHGDSVKASLLPQLNYRQIKYIFESAPRMFEHLGHGREYVKSISSKITPNQSLYLDAFVIAL